MNRSYIYLSLITLSCISLAVHAMDVDLDKQLMNAAKAGNIQAAQDLIAQGANINARNEEGWTPLMLAALYNRKNMIELLLKHRANINAQDNNGKTALMLAFILGNTGIIKLLLQNGASVIIENKNGKTALDLARETFYRATDPKEKAKYKELGKMILESYIKQKKLKGTAQAIEKAHVLPPEISKYFE